MSKQTIYNILAAKSEPVKVELATATELDNLTGNLLDTIKQIDQLNGDVKQALSLINKAANLISTVESTQELIQKELNSFRVDAGKLGLMADEIPQWKRLDSTLVASMRSLGSLIINLENIGRVATKV